MPFSPEDPKTKSVATYGDKTLDRVRIDSINIMLRDIMITEPQMVVAWSLGYMDGEEFVPVEKGGGVIKGAELQAAMDAAPVGDSVYDVVKNGTYAVLQAAGLLGAGTVD